MVDKSLEEIKSYFEKAKEELNLTEEDLKDFEKAREEAWKEIKKKYDL